MRCRLRAAHGPRQAPFLGQLCYFFSSLCSLSALLLLALPRACALRGPAASFSSSRAFGDVVGRVAAAMLCSVFRSWYCCAEPEAHSVHPISSRNSPRAPPVALTCSPWRRTECSDRGLSTAHHAGLPSASQNKRRKQSHGLCSLLGTSLFAFLQTCLAGLCCLFNMLFFHIEPSLVDAQHNR